MKKFLLTMACAAVFGFAQAADVTDVLTVESFTFEAGNSYQNVTYTSPTTGIAYAGKIAKNSGNLQFNNNDRQPGLVATANPNNYKIVSVKVTPGTNNKNTWVVYGNTTAYTAVTDLYDTNAAGEVIGSDSKEATVKATGDYNFFGFCSKKGALYISKIEITYTDGGAVAPDNRKDAGLKFSAESAEATLGEAFTAPTLSKITTAAVKYSSDAENIATVDPATGEVTLVAEGTARITATADANDEYKAGTAFYLLTVKKAPAVAPENAVFFSAMGEDFTFEHNATDFAAWSHDSKYGLKGSAYKNGINATVDYAVSPVIDLAEISDAKLSFKQAFNQYKINNELIEVANLPQYAEIVVREEGAAEWTKLATPTLPESFSWTFFDNEEISLAAYADKKIQVAFKYISTTECAGTWEVNEIAVTGTKEAPAPAEAGLSFPEKEYTVVFGEEFTAPELTQATDAAATYSSSAATVASVDPETGKVTINTVGTAVITAKTEATEKYEAGEASYTIIVKNAANLKFAEETVTIVLGEDGNIGDEIDLVALTKDTPADAKYTSSNEEAVAYVATSGTLKIAGVGETTITATTEATETYFAGEASYTIIVKEAEEPDYTEAIYNGLNDNGNDWTIDNANYGEVWSWNENGYMVAQAPATAPATGVKANITSPVINIQGYKDLTISFSQSIEGLDATDNPADYFSVLVSVDGEDFTEVSNFVTPEAETTWTLNTAALENVKGSTLQVRFVYNTKGTWMVKDVNVTGIKELEGIENVEAVESAEEVYYYNLQGVRVNNPENGIYIKVQGNKTSKVYVK